MKIRIKAANTEKAQYTWVGYLTSNMMLSVHDYIDELRQQAQWDKLKAS